MIKAVIFDYGNVISQASTQDVTLSMEKKTGVPASIFKSVYDRFRFDFDRGFISGTKMYSLLLQEEGYASLAKNEDLMKEIAALDLESWRPLNDDVVSWIREIKAMGYKTGILSNMPYEFLDKYEKEIPPFVEADYACFSCRVNIIKPDSEIYHICLKSLGVNPEEAVFFDDLEENIKAANKIGINGFLWQGLEKAKKDLSLLIG